MSLDNSSILPNCDKESSRMNVYSARFYTDKIVITNRPDVYTKKGTIKESSLANLKDNKVKGKLSRKSLLHVRKHLQAWAESVRLYNLRNNLGFNSTKRKLSMITLTLSGSQKHDDKYLKKQLFQRFIEWTTRTQNVKHYYIRYETQVNGNLHAHLIVDNYIHKEKITEKWNRLQDHLGYLNEYKKVHKGDNPPSTHVTSLDEQNNMLEYMLKYSTKDNNNRPVDGRQYGMSDSLKNIDVFETLINSELMLILNKIIDLNQKNVYNDEYFTIIRLGRQFIYHALSNRIKSEYNNYYYSLYNYLYNNDLHPYAKKMEKMETYKNHQTDNQMDKEVTTSDKIVETYIQTRIVFPECEDDINLDRMPSWKA